MRAYNLFRLSADRGACCCAVPEDCAVPRFLDAPGWRFDRRIDDGPAGATPVGFDARAAAAGARLNGFYLFESFGWG